jgi:hypothetical protein
MDYHACTNKGGGKVPQVSWPQQLMEKNLIKVKLSVSPETSTKIIKGKKRKSKQEINSRSKKAKMKASIQASKEMENIVDCIDSTNE